MASTSQSPAKLRPREILYIALEGGGGKGYAYLGALQLLENNADKQKDGVNVDILEQLEGVAGTSAGAITALMLSLGMTAREIEKELKNPTGLNDFNDFFDPATPRLVPKPFEYQKQKDNLLERQYLSFERTVKPDDLLKLASQLQSVEGRLALPFLSGWLFDVSTVGVLRWLSYLGDGEKEIADRVAKAKPPLSTLFSDQGYFTYVIRDMGFFSGYAARKYFDNLIAMRFAKAFGGDASRYANMTFDGHHRTVEDLRKFKAKKLFFPAKGFKDLMVCGSNFSTGQSQLFSWRHTPKFPMADAVRISMSLPIIYKPYVIRKHQDGWPPCGTYVDGGYWNNLPFREVNPDRPSSATLALRLEIDEPNRVETVYDVMLVMLLQALFGSGETQVTSEFKQVTIRLDTRDLDLLKFQPDDKTKAVVTKRSRRRVCRYFGWDIDKTDEDKEDDEETKKLDAMTACKRLDY